MFAKGFIIIYLCIFNIWQRKVTFNYSLKQTKLLGNKSKQIHFKVL